MTLQGITEDDIVNYLVHTPAFFERNAQLLASIELTSPHGLRAVSLQERQMEMMRDKVRGLERKIMEMIRNSQENEGIAERLHRWVQSVLLTHDDAALPEAMLSRLKHEFLIPQAAVRVWGTPDHPVREDLSGLAALEAVSSDARSFVASLSLPYCGINAGFEASKWLEDASTVSSIALIPLYRDGAAFGLLVLGSPDPTRYTADMGVAFLQQVGDVAGAALARLVA
jgi:uncharacterized protein YigA (DUF484 family)